MLERERDACLLLLVGCVLQLGETDVDWTPDGWGERLRLHKRPRPASPDPEGRVREVMQRLRGRSGNSRASKANSRAGRHHLPLRNLEQEVGLLAALH